MDQEIYDIVIPQTSWWLNLFQPGYWLLLITLVIGLLAIRFLRSQKRQAKRQALKLLNGKTRLTASQANACIEATLKQMSIVCDSRDRDNWRKQLIGLRLSPSFAEYLAFHYKEPNRFDEAEILTKTKESIRKLG